MDFKTDFKKGGTYDSNAKAAIESLLNKATNYKSKYFSMEYNPIASSISVKNEIKNQKHVEYLSICEYKVEIKRTLAADLNYNQEIRPAMQKLDIMKSLRK